MDLKAGLYLGKVTLKNYRSYKGTTVIDLSRDSKKTITVIEGAMGKGKTTIINAIYWCLYGEFRLTSNRSDENIINNDVLSSLEMDSEDDTSVEVHLYEEDELRYNIRRNIHFVKRRESARNVAHLEVDGRLPEGIEIESTVEFRHLPKLSDTYEWQVYTDPVQAKEAIQNIFPESLSLYFLFDAELLDNFFATGSQNKVKNGIEMISGLPVLDDTIKHIRATYDDIGKGIKSRETEPISEDIFRIESAKKKNEDIVSEADQRLKEINHEIEEIQSYLRTNDDELVQAKQKEADILRDKSSELRKELAKLDKEMTDWLLYSNTVARLHATMKDSLDMCDRWEKEGKIPIAVSSQALRNILRADPSVCICGAHLKEGSKERAHMTKLMEKNTADSPIIQNITTGRGHWDDMVSDTAPESLSEKLQERQSKREQLRSKLDGIEANRKEISRDLQKHDKAQIRDKNQRRSELQHDQKDWYGKKAVAENQIRRLSLELEQKNREMDRLTKNNDKFQSYSNRRELAKAIEAILKECRNDLVDELRKTVAEKTTEYFVRLVSRNDFAEVKIRPDYSVTAYGPTGHSKSLSAGQTCCLALSYIAAIRDIAEKNYFMVIDSPLHNIDQAERVDIAKNLPKFIPGTQITLLVQDQEYVGRVTKTNDREGIPSVRDILRENDMLWREYKLVHNETGKDSYNTTIEEMRS